MEPLFYNARGSLFFCKLYVHVNVWQMLMDQSYVTLKVTIRKIFRPHFRPLFVANFFLLHIFFVCFFLLFLLFAALIQCLYIQKLPLYTVIFVVSGGVRHTCIELRLSKWFLALETKKNWRKHIWKCSCRFLSEPFLLFYTSIIIETFILLYFITFNSFCELYVYKCLTDPDTFWTKVLWCRNKIFMK